MKNKEILFSIIIPIYNGEKYIKECLNSIIDQTFNNYEVIVVDDGSSDNSYLICKQISKLNSKIRIYKQENKGVSSARNYGLLHSNGEYIIFIDADDYIEENTLEVLFKNLKEINNNEMLVFGFKHKYKNCEIPFETQSFEIDSSNSFLEEQYLTNKYIGGALWNKVFVKKIITDNNLKFDSDIHYSEDLQFILKYSKYLNKIKYIGQQLYCYRIRKNSANYSFVSKKNASVLKLYLMLIDQYKNNKKMVNILEYGYIKNYQLLKNIANKEDIDNELINREKEIINNNLININTKAKILTRYPFIKRIYNKLKNIIRKPFN